MTERIVEFSQDGASVSLSLGRLLIERPGHPAYAIPLEEIAVVIFAHPAVKLTQPLLAAFADQGVPVIFCNERRLPVGMLLPIAGHHEHAKRVAAQARLSDRTRARLWQQIVQAKIAAQAACLERIRGDDFGLRPMIPRVRRDDRDNVEARAARRYWQALIPKETFSRNPQATDRINSMLNYGYAVLRAMVARAIVASGLHPGLGLHHHNRSNPFCLADDLMEPFRPLVDEVVVQRIEHPEAPIAETLTPEDKQVLIHRLMAGDEEETSLTSQLTRLTASLAAVCLGERKDLYLP